MQPQIETVGLCLVDHLLLGYDLLKIVIKKVDNFKYLAICIVCTNYLLLTPASCLFKKHRRSKIAP